MPWPQPIEYSAAPGAVTGYSTQSATLTLQHEYPKGSKAKVGADVTLLLQNLKSEQTDIGQWVHVIGYITSIGQALAKATTTSEIAAPAAIASVGVQALVLWTAEDLDISSYEQTLASETE
ncbi:CST complex subunit Ten1 [Durotheca rogersii]|uniref:CST complex subunit Ten1 n=1 Tax=Durotheca rogersii TaxID=419775 RepID=UPI00221FE278|nr:CST complex subunit Ten1 [Durotheca rogersii]KAI5860102.1 CST complex subunit Ten1 [Durotheca rogersii]